MAGETRRLEQPMSELAAAGCIPPPFIAREASLWGFQRSGFLNGWVLQAPPERRRAMGDFSQFR